MTPKRAIHRLASPGLFQTDDAGIERDVLTKIWWFRGTCNGVRQQPNNIDNILIINKNNCACTRDESETCWQIKKVGDSVLDQDLTSIPL